MLTELVNGVLDLSEIEVGNPCDQAAADVIGRNAQEGSLPLITHALAETREIPRLGETLLRGIPEDS